MKRRKIFGKSVSLILVISLLLGVTVAGVWATSSANETTEDPWAGYTRVTMENYGITASTDEAGTTYNSPVSGDYTGTSLKHTYLDVDVKYETMDGSNYFHYFGSADWENNIRMIPYTSGMSIKDTANRATLPWVTSTLSGFFNVKILTDIVANSDDATKEDVTIQFYLNDTYAGTMTWTEDAGQDHDNFYVYLASGSCALRTPAEEETETPGNSTETPEESTDPWTGYTRVTMENYGITASTDEAGTTYNTPVSGEYTGTSLNKTYLDVDVKYDTIDGNNYFHYFGSGDWEKNIRMIPYTSGLSIKDIGGRNTTTPTEPWVSCTISGFFNVKILTDIVTNASDATKEDVTLKFYVNDTYAATMTWTEDAGQDHDNFYVYLASGSCALRTPVVEGTETPEEPADPWADYTRITMANYGIAASSEETGTPYSASVSGTYTGNLNKTYLDVDIKFDPLDGNGSNYFHYFGSGDWEKNIRMIPYTSGMSIKDTGNRATLPWVTSTLSGFFNVKILTDIVANASDATKEDVTLQFYLNETYAGTMTWTEDKGQDHDNFYVYLKSGTYALRTPIIGDEADNYYDITLYRNSTPYTYPTKEGYVFGGWYTDVYLTEPLGSDVTAGYAYAKFVEKDVLTFKYQLPLAAEKENATTNLRLLTSVDSLDYQYIGFKLEYLFGDSTVTKTYKTKEVYNVVTGTVNGEQVQYKPDIFSDASTHIMAMRLYNVPQAVFEVTMTITPQWYTLDGTTVDGTPRDVVLFPSDSTGDGTQMTGYGTEFTNDNIAYYNNNWVY